MCLLSPYGGRVHGPLAIAAQAKIGGRTGIEVEVTYNDDGLVWRTGDMDELPEVRELLPSADEVERYVTEHLGRSALFASMFRENAGRSLLLTRRSVDGRNPLWSQRLKAKNLLGIVQRYPRFPIVLETYRQCLQDIFDLPGLVALLKQIEAGDIRLEVRETQGPSPFAASVVFEHVAQYLYEVDAPAAEMRARALSLDRSLLRELLGAESERTLVDLEVLLEIEARLQRTHSERRARDRDQLHDVFRELGALTPRDAALRCDGPAEEWLEALKAEGRITPVGDEHYAAVEVAALYRAALDWSVGPGALELDDVEAADPIGQLIRTFAARRGPFSLNRVATFLGAPSSLLQPVL
ncbi:MAG: DEAD/DEAH box helicase, partial [Myxococcota bacterium]